ncbi:MAG: hypothetical protein GY869_08445, partial [Planctomycetes bacterium]|nr:hypothetical protein [Planctomycetota bacterium]
MKNKGLDPTAIEAGLLKLYAEKSDLFLSKWGRLLPLNEMIIDRWRKAERL